MTLSSTPADDFAALKVAIVHEWFVDYSGSERVVEQMLRVFPQADLFSQVDFLPADQRDFILNKKVHTSFIQRLPAARKHYRAYLPLMPLAVEQFDLSDYDLVISSNHAVAKGVITGPDQLHVCMCYSPIRYAWDMTHQYLAQSGLGSGLKAWVARLILHRMRLWDLRTVNGVDEFIAISRHIQRRIDKCYRRISRVIYPPVDVDTFDLCTKKENFYLTASRLVPYKRVDLIVKAFRRMPDKKLVVIGDGPEYSRIRRMGSANITFLGYQGLSELRDHLQRAKAFVFAACEDFGILPVEAQACGTPVIAYGRGGALETVVDGRTGLFFHSQTPEAIIDAVQRFESSSSSYDPAIIRNNALRFAVSHFQNDFCRFMQEVLDKHFRRSTPPSGRRLQLKGVQESVASIPDDDVLMVPSGSEPPENPSKSA